jgi:hypothetical protein
LIFKKILATATAVPTGCQGCGIENFFCGKNGGTQ